jgi:putative aldouronate transport system substrate-binding protein
VRKRGLGTAACAAAVVALLASLAGCSARGGEPAGASKGFVKIVGLFADTASNRMTSFLAGEFKKRMKADLNLEVEVLYSPWDQWNTKRDLMTASGEQLDFFWVPTNDAATVVAKKLLQPIGDVFDKYGEDIRKVLPKENVDAFRTGGAMWVLPVCQCPTAEWTNSILVRQDILEDVGMREIRTVDDVTKFGRLAAKKHPDMKLISCVMTRILARAYTSAPFIVAGDCIAIDPASGKVSDFYETEAFKKACEQVGKWKAEGFVPDDVTTKPGEHLGRFDSGNYLITEGAITRPFEEILNVRKNAPAARLKEYLLDPEKPRYRFMSSTDAVGIGINCKTPDRVMQFFNWIYKDPPKNWLFTIYGVEGKDYTVKDGGLHLINTDTLFYEWVFRNFTIELFPDYIDKDTRDSFVAWDKGSVVPKCFGFMFNADPVKTQLARMSTVASERFIPLSTGFVDFKGNYAPALKELKAAGVDAYCAEYQKQLDAYVKGK